MPFLPFEGKYDEQAIVMQVYPFAVQEQMPGSLAEEIELKEISLVPFMQVEPSPSFRAFICVQQEIYATAAFRIFNLRYICSAVLQGNIPNDFLSFMIHANTLLT